MLKKNCFKIPLNPYYSEAISKTSYQNSLDIIEQG